MGVKPNGSKGFTLLEILVALALIGLMFVGIGAIQKQQVNTQSRLEEQLAAAQLAHNLMEMFRAEGMPIHPEQQTGEETIAGQLFSFSRQITPIDEGKGYEVRIQVGDKQAPLFVESMRWLVR